MKTARWRVGLACALCMSAGSAFATDWFVATNGNDSAAGTNWATAKQTIQAAVDAAVSNDTVWVSNGVYATGGRSYAGAWSNRVAIGKPITVQSVHGPETTYIVGGGMRCVYVTNGAVLSGFTLTNGISSEEDGGGVLCAENGRVNNCILVGNQSYGTGGGSSGGRLYNCQLTGNSAMDGGGSCGSELNQCRLADNSAGNVGGGSYGGTLNNCLLTGNNASGSGGARFGTLNNCTVVGNSGGDVGGANGSVLNNCIVYDNIGNPGFENHLDCTFANSCTTPDPGGTGNITDNPQFVNAAGGDHRLNMGSPCVDTGNNAYVQGTTDLDGNPRILNGTVDMGAYELWTALMINPTSTNLSFEAASGMTIEVTASVAWAATTNVPWLSITSGDSGTTNGTVVFNVQANESASSRTGTIVVAGGGLSRTCAVVQAAFVPVLVIDPVSTNLSSDVATGQTIEVTARVPWTATTNVPWLTITSGDSGTTNGTVVFSAEANGVAVARTGALIVAGGGLSRTCTVVQAAFIPALTIAPTSTNLTCDAASGRSIAVTANVPWTASTNVPWLEITSDASGTTNGTLVFSVTSNGLATSRTGAVVVAGGGLTRTCTVVQAAVVGYSENLFVATNGNDSAWGTNWATAKQTIQAAVDAATNGSTVWVSNGVYETEATETPGYTLLNRVVITNHIEVRSVNGPAVTVIQGQGPRGTNAVRCVYMTAGSLIGFTVSGGCTRTDRDGTYDQAGGGIFMYPSTAPVVSNCVINGNSAYNGGGAIYGKLYNCVIRSNTAEGSGGGITGATLYNCEISRNTALSCGGGCDQSTLFNCTLASNNAWWGGGAYNCTLYNSIVYSNSSENLNLSGPGHCTCQYTCSTPLPSGTGNITNIPQFADAAAGNFRLKYGSPCIDRGSNAYVVGTTDLDGNPRIIYGTVDMGAYEFWTALMINPTRTNLPLDASSGRSIAVWANVPWTAATNVPWIEITSGDSGATNGTVVFSVTSNGLATSRTGAVVVAGGGLTRTYTVVQAAVVGYSENLFVATNGNDSAWGTNWATAKKTIQAAVDAATNGSTVWVSNGVYETGATETPGYTLLNRVVITNHIEVRSVNGPAVTVIQGQGPRGTNAVRCVYMTAGNLIGFTVSGGCTRTNGNGTYDRVGGGIFMYPSTTSVVSNCVINGNSAYNAGGAFYGKLYNCVIRSNSANWAGGGAEGSTLFNCELSGNSGNWYGGGCDQSTLFNCTLASNNAVYGGGAYECTLYNSIVYSNSLVNHEYCTCQYTCSTPLPSGTGNITNNPRFADAGAGNYRLGTNSPCINGGDNALVQGDTDVDGNPRIALGVEFGRVDMGAHEFLSRVWYVATGGSDAAVGTNWATAKATIQAAIDAADFGDMTMVSNGVYATGGRVVHGALTNRVAIDKPNTVQSVNGPEATIIQGAWDPATSNGLGNAAVRCAYVGTNAVLAGFILTQGATRPTGLEQERKGGGAWCETSGTLRNCLLAGNSANLAGGGSQGGTLINCTVVSNTAGSGGGVSGGTLNNCIVYNNTAPSDSNYTDCSFQYSCTTPDPGGTGNVAGDPQFADAVAGNYRLQPTSPCIDAGDNGVVQWDEDLDGNSRIAYGTVDMGAYEAQLTGPGTWFGAITNGQTNDQDCVGGDGVPNLLKYATGSSPRISDDMVLMNLLSGGSPTLVFNRNPNATDITFLIQGADAISNGAAWRGLATNIGGSWGGATNVNESGTGNPVVCTVTDPVALQTNRFLRLKVTRP